MTSSLTRNNDTNTKQIMERYQEFGEVLGDSIFNK